MDPPREGETHSYERRFSVEEVREFADISGDRQPQHVEPGEDGEVMVHGLLTASLPTKIGGDLAVLASEMTFAFHRPVYTGERVVCTWRNDRVEERDDRYVLSVSVECEDGTGETVLTGDVEGVVWKE